MDTNNVAKKRSASSNKTVIVTAAAVVVAVVLVAVMLVAFLRKEPTDNSGIIGYAEASVFLDQDTLQAAMDEAMKNAAEQNVALWYRNDAYSNDGKTFECFVGNSKGNAYDMFLTIYADPEMTDQLFLSGLVRPGSGFEEISLEHTLSPGMNTVYVAVTLVDTEEDGAQTIKSQVVHTMDFHVPE